MTQSYTVQQAAEATGVSEHTLRYYERIGLLQNVPRAKNGYRRYSESNLGWLRFVLLLRATGMPLEQIQDFMMLEQQGANTLDQRLILLQHHRTDIAAQIEALCQHLKTLDAKITYYQSASPQTCDCLIPASEGEPS